MNTLENTFERQNSPSYSDDINADNIAAVSLRNCQLECGVRRPEDYFQHLQNITNYYTSKHRLRYRCSTVAFWTVVLILLILTISNLILTLSIIGVLRLGRGIHGMELIPEEDIIKFYGISDLDRIYTKNVCDIGGFINVPISLTSEGAAVNLRIHHRNGQIHNRLVVDKWGVQFRGINSFDVKDPESGSTIFTSHRPHYNIPQGADMLKSKTASVSRIASAVNETLSVSAPDARISIRGSEGIYIDAAAIYMQAERNIHINFTQGAVTFLAGTGIFLDMEKIPIVKAEMGLRTGSVQYKLCVCMPQGIVFRIEILRVHNGPKISCAHFSSKHDPCAIN